MQTLTTSTAAPSRNGESPAVEEQPCDDAVLLAIENLVSVLDNISEVREFIVGRGEHIRMRRAGDVTYSTIVTEEERPLIVERARVIFNDLVEATGRLQRAEARALHDEGLSMDRIAALFGVTRQRIADFLRSSEKAKAQN
jgi:hypothetical protein